MRTSPQPQLTGQNEHLPRVTARAPHLRLPGDLSSLMRGVLIAVTPCLVFGLYNSGYQANQARLTEGRSAPAGWRTSVLEAIGVQIDPGSIFDCVGWGVAFFLPLLVATSLTALACERAFSTLRKRRPSPGLAVTIVLFTLCLPPTVPWWQAALGIAFGVVIGREVFGGTGRNFLNPALTGLVFIYFSYPLSFKGQGVWTAVDGFTGATTLSVAAVGGMQAVQATGLTWIETFLGFEPGSFGETSALGCLIGGAYLVARHIASWRIIWGAVLGAVATVLLFQLGETRGAESALPWFWQLTTGGFAFGVVFMATDPVSAAMTRRGRVLYGALIGGLIVLIRAQSPVHPEGVMLAILLGNVFAPLIDTGVIRVHSWRRSLRHG